MKLPRTSLPLIWSFACATVSAQTLPSTRGQLLYATHCIACHDKQVHWRDARQATNWESLKQQVRQWQGSIGQSWSDADIVEVTRYLNETIYKFPQTSDRRT